MGQTMTLIPLLALLIVIAVGLIVLEIFLSLQKNKWFGLILPIAHTLFLMIAIILAIMQHTDPYVFTWTVVNLYLIPEVVIFIIYALCQSKVQAKSRKADEIAKMKIQDLK